MKYLMMDWFGKFKCIGGTCPATCCAGWGIAIDDKTREKYDELKETGDEMFERYSCEEGGNVQLLGEKCPFLTEDGWCKIVNKYGEEMLSNTCKIYPRVSNIYGDVNECTVKISCPVVAEYLLSEEEITFIFAEDDKEEQKECDYVVYDGYSHARNYIVDLLQEYRQYPLTGRLFCMLDVNYKLEQLYKGGQFTVEKVDALLAMFGDSQYLEGVCSQVQELNKNLEIKRKSIIQLFQVLFRDDAILVDRQMDSELNTYLQSIERNPEIFYRDYGAFSKFCEEHERVYENYFIYQYFIHIMPNHNKELTWRMAVAELCYIQLTAMIAWKKEKQLDTIQYRDIIVSVAKRLEHNDEKSEQRNRFIIENGFEDIAPLWMCLLV